MSKGRILSYTLHELTSHDILNGFFRVSAKPRGWELGIILLQPSFPLYLFMQDGAGEFGWMGSPSSSVLANTWAGDKGQPLQMTSLPSFILGPITTL
jgi:hypothetical protein